MGTSPDTSPDVSVFPFRFPKSSKNIGIESVFIWQLEPRVKSWRSRSAKTYKDQRKSIIILTYSIWINLQSVERLPHPENVARVRVDPHVMRPVVPVVQGCFDVDVLDA